MSTWWGDSRNMEEIEFSRWLFEGRPRQGKIVLPDGLNWLCYFAGSSKSHRENSISCIFLESPHQVDMENVVKSYKHFFGYFNALKTNCDITGCCKQTFHFQFNIKLIQSKTWFFHFSQWHKISNFFTLPDLDTNLSIIYWIFMNLETLT